ncbi:MAG: hypothetical protein ACE3JN_12440 [Ectobacillus sp.]
MIWNERRRLQQEKRGSQDTRLSAAREAARPRLQKASACSGKSTIKFNRANKLKTREFINKFSGLNKILIKSP